MSNLFSSKPSTKPLKGGIVSSNYGTFDTITANTLVLESITVAGVLEDGFLENVTITNSVINNTIIGFGGRNKGYFTNLDTNDSITFGSSNPLTNYAVTWDPDTGIFNINNILKVDGCSELGNIEICENTIRSINTNGDINIVPNGFGQVYVKNAFNNITSTGNFYVETSNGEARFNVKNNYIVNASAGANIVTQNDQTYTTTNGDINLSVDTGISNKSISNVNYTAGNIVINTGLSHSLQEGDVISLTNNLLSGNFTVGSILSPTRFQLTTTQTIGNTVSTGGSLIKYANNNINLNTNSLVTIPTNSKLTFGSTSNNISGNSTGLYLNSLSDLYLNVSSANRILVPDTTRLIFGNSDVNSIRSSDSNLLISSTTLEINSTNTQFYDPILTLGNYTLNSNDNKDRGIEFRYFDSTSSSMKLGWFGFKNSTKNFTFIPDAINNNEIISGSAGSFELSNLNVTNVNISGGTLDLSCGKIINANLISGCSNTITINGSTNVNLTATNRISLQAGTDILIPNNIPLKFGTSGNYILEVTNGNLNVIGQNNVRFTTASSGSLIIPVQTYLSFDGSSIGNQRISSNTSGDLIVNTNKDLYLTTTGGNVIIPINTRIYFGNSTQTINGDASGILINSSNNIRIISTTGTNILSNSNINIIATSGNILLGTKNGDLNLYPTGGNIRIPIDTKLIFNTSGTSNNLSVITNGNFVLSGQTTNSFNFETLNSINLENQTYLNIGSGGNKYIYSDNSNVMYIQNTTTNGNLNLTSNTTNLINTTGTLNINNSSTNISSSSVLITGNQSRINSTNLNIQDPIVTIGDYTLASNDNKDRGIEYKYYDSSMKLGWFGLKNSSGKFTYYSNAVNTNEVISGTRGDLEISSIYLDNGIYFNTRGNLDLNCGSIINANTISACGNNLTITSGTLNLSVNDKIVVPYNIKIAFGTTNNNISCDSVGNLQLTSSSKIILNSDVQINGTTTNIYSTVTNLQDPIFSLGGVIGPVIDDGKDRGIEFKWNNSSSSKTGFFGYKNALGRFVFIRDGININEVYSGVYGDVEFNNAYLQNISLNNGNISGVNSLSGGEVTILSTSGNIYITPTSGKSVIFPFNSNIAFGSTNNSISVSTSGSMILNSNSISMNTTDFVRISNNVPLYFGNDNSTFITNTTNNNLQITNSDGNINLTPQFSSGSINIPTYNYLNFGSSSNSIYSNGDKLILNGYSAVDITSSTISFAGDINIIGTLTAGAIDFDLNKYILPLGTFQILNITSIQKLTPTDTSGNLKVTVDQPHYLTVGDTVTLTNTNCKPAVDGEYSIESIIDSTNFVIKNSLITLTQNGTSGTVKSNLKQDQNKDVGIQVNYWSTTGNANATTGSAGYKTGFFGFKENTERWSFYTNATITNNVVTGNVGDIDVNKVFTNRISGFTLDGNLSGGSNIISGNNFQIAGGTIINTPIGQAGANTGRFTTLTNTTEALFENVTFNSAIYYSMDIYTLSSTVLTRNPVLSNCISLFKVNGVNLTVSGTMPTPSGSQVGMLKMMVCNGMGLGCAYTLQFPTGRLIAPNPLNPGSQPTKLIFKRQGQSAQLLWDGTAWILLNSGGYVE